MEAFLVSASVVALAEIGDKTQLLAFLLAAKFRRPLPIIAGILAATLVNHAVAGAAGIWLRQFLTPDLLRYVLATSFLAMAIWSLKPDRYEDDAAPSTQFGVFGATALSFFLAEIGDKTQLATLALAAKYQSLWAVIAGTTLGMMAADVPAVLLGDRFAQRVPARPMRLAAAAIFALLGIATLFGTGDLLAH